MVKQVWHGVVRLDGYQLETTTGAEKVFMSQDERKQPVTAGMYQERLKELQVALASCIFFEPSAQHSASFN